jgi:Abnormal spindle-like microcephaly-assoc'd, ASPM-SPD-2-Hydin
VSGVSPNFRFLGAVQLVPADPFIGEFSKRNMPRMRREAKNPRLEAWGWGKIFLFALACCLTIVASGCSGTAATDPAVTTGTPQSSPQLTVSAASLSFGSVTVNTATTQSVTLASTGTSPLTINSATIAGTGFTIVSSGLPVTLNPTQSATLQVQFDPTAAGAASGQITISSNSANGSTTMVALAGTGTTASGPQTSPQLGVSAASLSFGSLTVNTAATQPLTLTSTGTSPVTINSAAITGAGFTIVAQSFPVTLNPTQSVTVQVQFDPTAAGAASGQITISSNSTTGGTAVVALSGTGTAGNPQLTISTASLSFGSVAVNTPTTQTLTLTSTGTTAVTVNSAVISGAGFTIVGGSFPVTLNPTQTLTLQLQFDPTTAGALTGQFTISSNSTTGNTAVIALSGTGTAVAHEVDLSWDAPASSPDPVAGYNIYRATGSGSFVLINSSPDATVVYTDSAVVSGTNYSYQVTSVDSSGVESIPSNQITVTIP